LLRRSNPEMSPNPNSVPRHAPTTAPIHPEDDREAAEAQAGAGPAEATCSETGPAEIVPPVDTVRAGIPTAIVASPGPRFTSVHASLATHATSHPSRTGQASVTDS
jgi:hypothetical protein